MLLHADNFNVYGEDENLLTQGEYAQRVNLALVADPDGESIPRVIRYNENSSAFGNCILRKVLPAPVGHVGISARYWLQRLPSRSDELPEVAVWLDGDNDEIGSVVVTTTGALQYRDHNNNVQGTTAGPVLTANTWFHVESRLVLSTLAVANLEVRVEGRTVLLIEDFSTSEAICPQVRTGVRTSSIGSNPAFYHKDYVIWDNTGTRNTDFLGGVIVHDLEPTSDVAFPWTSTGPNGFSVLDNNPPTDVDFISAVFPNTPTACQFEMGNLPANVSSVKGLFVKYRAAKIDGGDAQLQASVTSNGVDGNGNDRPLTVAQTYLSDLFEEDPDTNQPWVPGAVDAASIKLNRTV